MKILLATPSLRAEIGGPAYSVSSIKSFLEQAGVETTTFTQHAQGGASLPLFGDGHMFDGVDLVHTFGTWTPFGHRIAVKSRQAKIPYIFCPMGMLEPWSLAQKRFKKQLGLTLYQRRDIECSAAIHATAVSEAENLRALGIKAPIAVIPHGIDLPLDLPVRSLLDQSSGEKTFLFLSRIHPKKGLLELVEACTRLKDKNWKVIIAGTDSDSYQAVVEDAVNRAKLQENFSFVGPVYGEQKAGLFAKADVFVLPTHSENFGLVIAEALAHGVPVITTTGAPWAELNTDGCGWWIPTGVDALEKALVNAISRPLIELVDMGARGRKLIEERYMWPALIQKHVALYDWILGTGPRPDFIFD